MKRDAPLNERQAQVLRWVADGCPVGLWAGNGHKVTAKALQNRGLVTVSRKCGMWWATLTDTGARHLRQEAEAGQPERPDAPHRAGHKETRPGPDARAAGVAVPGVPERTAELGEQQGPAATASTPAARRVPVPAQLRGPLPVVQALREAAKAHKPGADGRLDLRDGEVMPVQVSRAALPRLLRVLQAVGREAELRGARLEVPAIRDRRGDGGRATGVLVRGDDQVAFRLFEETNRVPHAAGPAEVARARQEPWWKPPAFDHHPSGRLRLMLQAPGLKRCSFADGVRRRLEDQLARFFDAAEEALAHEVSERLDRQRRQDDQRRQVDLAGANAQTKAEYERLAEIAERQAGSWRTAQELRRYADALRAAAGDEDVDATAWAQWIRTHADDTDPLTRRVGRSPDRVPTRPEL